MLTEYLQLQNITSVNSRHKLWEFMSAVDWSDIFAAEDTIVPLSSYIACIFTLWINTYLPSNNLAWPLLMMKSVLYRRQIAKSKVSCNYWLPILKREDGWRQWQIHKNVITWHYAQFRNINWSSHKMREWNECQNVGSPDVHIVSCATYPLYSQNCPHVSASKNQAMWWLMG